MPLQGPAADEAHVTNSHSVDQSRDTSVACNSRRCSTGGERRKNQCPPNRQTGHDIQRERNTLRVVTGFQSSCRKRRQLSEVMTWFVVGRAVFVRLLFAVHGIIAVWLLYTVTGDPRVWFAALGLFILLVEGIVTIGLHRGHEWKWSVCFRNVHIGTIKLVRNERVQTLTKISSVCHDFSHQHLI